MNAVFSAGDNKPSGSTCTDSTGEKGGAVDLGAGWSAWVEEGSLGESTTVRRAWHKWSFLRTSRGSSVLLRSLSLPPMDWTMSG